MKSIRWLVLGALLAATACGDYSNELLKEVEHIYKFITENYQQKTEIGPFIVLRYLPRSIEVPR